MTINFQAFADTNSLTVRYDNDPRPIPTSGLWCECNVDFGIANQSELGVDKFRNIGNLVIKIKNATGLGSGELLGTADLIADSYRSVDVANAIFGTPRIRKIGRVEDNSQVNVICPFFADKVGK